jgi:alpha-mannosidase
VPETMSTDAAANTTLVENLRAELSDLAASPVAAWSVTTVDDPDNASATGGPGWADVALPHDVTGSPVAWFRTCLTAPETHYGWPVAGAPLSLVVSVRHNADVYVNGRFITRIHRGDRKITLTPSAGGGETFHVALRVSGPGSRQVDTSEGSTGRSIGLESAALETGALDAVRAAIVDHLDRMEVSSRLITLTGQGDYVLQQAASEVDRAAIARGDEAAVLESIERANEALTGLDDLFKRYTISLTSNAHIDMAWLWDREETKQVTHDTFRSVLDLMHEYPDFVFAQSQAQAYAWVEEYWPEMFEEIRARVKEGRWEIVGGMWVEPDCNLPNGESFVRQVLYGKRYFQEKFGVDVSLGWNPDSFGYNWSMPQVYRKCGINAFLTQKLTWNDTNVWPHRAFWWESPDGSRIFSYFPTDYVGHVDGRRLIKDLASFAGATGYRRTDHLYGIGDHGGGPTRDMLDRADALAAKTPFPTVRHQRARDFFDTLIAEADDPGVSVPVWNSELYLEYHRGTFTSQAAIKQGNRMAERLLRDAETFSAIAARAGRPYPQDTLEELWKLTLFNQFHDILPGSCIGAAAQDAWGDYARIQADGGEILEGALQSIAASLGAPGGGAAVAVFNGLGYDREDVASVPLAGPGPPGRRGAPRAARRRWRGPLAGRGRGRRARRCSSWRWSRPSARQPTASCRARPAGGEHAERFREPHRERVRLRVEINPDGTFGRVFHKDAGFEALAPGEAGNVLQAFVDNPGKWEAWEIDKDFEEEGEDLRGPVSIEVLEAGPVRARVRTTRRWRKSTFVQDIILTAGSCAWTW